MSTPLLATKFYPPPLRPDRLPRPDLVNRAEDGLWDGQQFLRRLTLFSATTGYGKTTAARTWLDSWMPHLAWLSLDEGDDDPFRFWRYVVAALARTDPSIGEQVQQVFESMGSGMERLSATEIIRGALTTLINSLMDIDAPLILVLDDYHHVSNESIHRDMEFLVDNLPPTLHLVVVSRIDPPWPLARWRIRGNMRELRQQDLRLRASETGTFLESFGVQLAEVDVVALQRRTEGWPAGLQMAGLSLQGHPDPRRFVETFAGSSRYLVDYLGEEVLDGLPTPIRDFLLETAVLDQLCAPLCDAVTSREDSRAMLGALQTRNLFLLPLDDHGEWYRYHSLFADLLRHRARWESPTPPRDSRLRAARWYEREGFLAEAITMALAADALDVAETLLAKHIDKLWKSAGVDRLIRWFDALSVERIRERPILGVYFSFVCLIDGRFPDALPMIKEVEDRLATHDESIPDGERRSLEGIVRVLRAFIASFQGDQKALLSYADGILDYFPERTLWRFSAAALAGDLASLRGDQAGMEAAYHLAIADGIALQDTFGSLFMAQRLGFN